LTRIAQVPFDEALEDATGGNAKVLTSSLSSFGKYAVVDQGQQFVSGYVNDANLLYRRNGEPIILFGDHTKIIKYIDFDFVLGADGVKALKSRPGFHPRYLLHYLHCIPLPNNLGYSRHFKYLKAATVPKPSLDEQVRIAAVLDKADAVRKKRREAISLADEFLRSVFLDMFGDPVTNSKGWDDLPIKEIAVVTTGNTPSRQVPDYFGDHIEWIKSDNINTANHHLTKATEGLSLVGLEVGRSVPAGSTLVTCIAGSPTCIGNAALADRRVAFNQQINALTPKPDIEPEFLYATALFSKVRIQDASTNGMKGMVSKGALEQVHFILPPKPERREFVRTFEKVLATLQKMHMASDEADHLFESLQQQAFS
jgi:type I restriction enzyme S subunit